jgi:hypothetical protein
MRKITFAVFLILIFSGICLARDFSGSVISLERRNYDSTNHASLDGIIFFPAKIKYRYIRRLDDDHRLRLNTRQGQEAVVVNPAESARYEKLIAENKLYPHVLLGKDGREVFTVYCNLRLKITWDQENNNEIYLEVRDPFQKENRESLFEGSLFGIRK